MELIVKYLLYAGLPGGGQEAKCPRALRSKWPHKTQCFKSQGVS